MVVNRSTSPIHCHPGADEIYHVLEGNGLFKDGRVERRLGPVDTVIFPAGEVHEVTALTRVLHPVQAGADRHPESLGTWAAKRRPGSAVSSAGGCRRP
jgi:uncharacterized cupin superfamily protein